MKIKIKYLMSVILALVTILTTLPISQIHASEQVIGSTSLFDTITINLQGHSLFILTIIPS